MTYHKGRYDASKEGPPGFLRTSNLGSGAIAGKHMGFGAQPTAEDGADDLRARITEAIKRHLRPELLNRISQTVVFNPLRKEDVRQIIDKFIARLNQRLGEQNMALVLDESAYLLLMECGFSNELGARPMERAIERSISQPLAKAILEKRVETGAKLCARALDGRIKFDPP